MVAQARGSRERLTAMRALGDFYTAYWYPLYAFARRKGWRRRMPETRRRSFFSG
jgi:hypothetical protein